MALIAGQPYSLMKFVITANLGSLPLPVPSRTCERITVLAIIISAWRLATKARVLTSSTMSAEIIC